MNSACLVVPLASESFPALTPHLSLPQGRDYQTRSGRRGWGDGWVATPRNRGKSLQITKDLTSQIALCSEHRPPPSAGVNASPCCLRSSLHAAILKVRGDDQIIPPPHLPLVELKATEKQQVPEELTALCLSA